MPKPFAKLTGWDGYKAEANSLDEMHQIINQYLRQWMQSGDRIIKTNMLVRNTYVAYVVNRYYEHTDASISYEVLE